MAYITDTDKQPGRPGQPGQPTSAKKVNPLVTGLVVLGVVAAAILLVKFLGDRALPDVPGVTLTDLKGVEDLRARFNADKGAPRLVLFFSPT